MIITRNTRVRICAPSVRVFSVSDAPAPVAVGAGQSDGDVTPTSFVGRNGYLREQQQPPRLSKERRTSATCCRGAASDGNDRHPEQEWPLPLYQLLLVSISSHSPAHQLHLLSGQAKVTAITVVGGRTTTAIQAQQETAHQLHLLSG